MCMERSRSRGAFEHAWYACFKVHQLCIDLEQKDGFSSCRVLLSVHLCSFDRISESITEVAKARSGRTKSRAKGLCKFTSRHSGEDMVGKIEVLACNRNERSTRSQASARPGELPTARLGGPHGSTSGPVQLVWPCAPWAQSLWHLRKRPRAPHDAATATSEALQAKAKAFWPKLR